MQHIYWNKSRFGISIKLFLLSKFVRRLQFNVSPRVLLKLSGHHVCKNYVEIMLQFEINISKWKWKKRNEHINKWAFFHTVNMWRCNAENAVAVKWHNLKIYRNDKDVHFDTTKWIPIDVSLNVMLIFSPPQD